MKTYHGLAEDYINPNSIKTEQDFVFPAVVLWACLFVGAVVLMVNL